MGASRSPRAHLRIKNAGLSAGVGDWERSIKRVLLAVLLDAGRTQPGQAVLVDRILPGEEFLDRQGVAAASFFERQQSAAYGGDDFCLAAYDPTLRPRRREIGDCQGGTVRPDDVFNPRAMGFCHSNSHQLTNSQGQPYAGPLKICLSKRRV